MRETVSFPVYADSMAEYCGEQELDDACRRLGCHGIEAVWGGDDAIDFLTHVTGYHLTFYPDWVDFWRGDEPTLLEKFGNRESYLSFYGGAGKEILIEQYRADIARAVRLGADYVVFHVSDVSIEEGYTYQWQHTNREVLDASLELINLLFEGKEYPFELLVENQWWPGFTFTEPEETRYLLDGICYKNKGIMLDTGHLMNTNTDLLTQTDGTAYLHRMLDKHGSLCTSIHGMHLHQSLSGDYVRTHTGVLPPLPESYLARFGQSYEHILQIDRHQPWTEPSIAGVIDRISPKFLTHELSCASRVERERVVALQKETLRKGGLSRCKRPIHLK